MTDAKKDQIEFSYSKGLLSFRNSINTFVVQLGSPREGDKGYFKLNIPESASEANVVNFFAPFLETDREQLDIILTVSMSSLSILCSGKSGLITMKWSSFSEDAVKNWKNGVKNGFQ